jgi:hypothetical protein
LFKRAERDRVADQREVRNGDATGGPLSRSVTMETPVVQCRAVMARSFRKRPAGLTKPVSMAIGRRGLLTAGCRAAEVRASSYAYAAEALTSHRAHRAEQLAPTLSRSVAGRNRSKNQAFNRYGPCSRFFHGSGRSPIPDHGQRCSDSGAKQRCSGGLESSFGRTGTSLTSRRPDS